jgi:hypothetical protein
LTALIAWGDNNNYRLGEEARSLEKTGVKEVAGTQLQREPISIVNELSDQSQ